jgi:pimeloyl-ACP methyl ester carboxylesterase
MDGIDFGDHAAAITAPTLLIGAAEDSMTPVDAAPSGIGMRDLESIIPASRLTVIDGAGHFLWFERPDAGAAEIVDFVLAADPRAHLAALPSSCT